MSAAAESKTVESDSLHLVSNLIAKEKTILELKAEGRTCLHIQREIGIVSRDKSAIKHLRQTFFGEKIGSLPCWNMNHEPIKNSPENAMHMIHEMGLKPRVQSRVV